MDTENDNSCINRVIHLFKGIRSKIKNATIRAGIAQLENYAPGLQGNDPGVTLPVETGNLFIKNIPAGMDQSFKHSVDSNKKKTVSYRGGWLFYSFSIVGIKLFNQGSKKNKI